MASLAPVTFAIARWLAGIGPVDERIVWAAPVLAVLAAVTLLAKPRMGQVLGTASVLTLAIGAWKALLLSPGTLLFAGIGSWLALAWIWSGDYDVRGLPHSPPRLLAGPAARALRRTILLAGPVWLIAVLFPVLDPGRSGWTAALAGATMIVFASLRVLASFWVRPPGWIEAAVAAGGGWVWIALYWNEPSAAAGGAVAASLAVAFFSRRRRESSEQPSLWEVLLEHPARFLVLTFLGLCAAGTVALSLDVSAASGEGIALLDAAFTAVSAVCVTGLIVLDTPTVFSFPGQIFLLTLIQLGGLGIMAFSTAAMGILGRRLSLRHEAAISSMLSLEDRNDFYIGLKRLLGVTFGSEAAGAAILAVAFYFEGDSLPAAVWRGLFTAVSAFCNAGFALQTDNLIPYQENPAVLHTVSLLIILGGLSPAAILGARILARGGRVTAQIRLVLSVTAALLVAGAILFAAIEWNHSLAGLAILDRLHNAWFQSVTLRTAGFNSVDFTRLAPASLTFMIAWMFIGGSPGGTAGGIKTTTGALLVLAVVAAIRGRTDVEVFGRRVPQETIYRAAAIATMGLFSALLLLLMMQLTQNIPLDKTSFEVVSALATVGLSTGATAMLDEVGKVLIMIGMFAGRVGPLTLFIFLAGRSAQSLWQYPEEPMDVG